MSTSDADPIQSIQAENHALQAELVRKAAAEADLAELQVQQQKAFIRQTLKSTSDGTASPGVIAGQDEDPPTKDETAATDVTAYKGQAKPREGTVVLDAAAGYMTTIVAYQAMLHLADAIAEEVNALNLADMRIMLVESLDIASGDVALLQLNAQLGAWKDELERLNKLVSAELAPATGAPPAKTILPMMAFLAPALIAGMSPTTLLPLLIGAVSATADLVGYFKTDYQISGRDVSVSDVAIRARVAGKITDVPVYLQDYYRVQKSPVIEAFNQVAMKLATLQQNLELLKSQIIDPLAAQIAALGVEIEQLQNQIRKLKLPAQEDEKKELEAQLAVKTEALANAVKQKRAPDIIFARGSGSISIIDAAMRELTAVPEGQQLSLLSRAALRDYLSVLGITHLLYVTVDSAGGEVVTGKNWFLGAPQAGYLAGGVVSYVLSEVSGAIVSADTFTGTDYLKYKLGQDVLK